MDLELKQRTIKVGRRYVTAVELTIAQMAERAVDLIAVRLYASLVADVRGKDHHTATVAMDAIAVRMAQCPAEFARLASASCHPRQWRFLRRPAPAILPREVFRMTRIESYALLAAVLAVNGWDKAGGVGDALPFGNACARVCLLTGWTIDEARNHSPRQVSDILAEHTRRRQAELADDLMIMRAAMHAEDVMPLHAELMSAARETEPAAPRDPRDVAIEMAAFCGDEKAVKFMVGMKKADDAMAEKIRLMEEADRIIGNGTNGH